MTADPSIPQTPRSRFRGTLIRVLVVQAIAMLLLGLLQLLYGA